MDTISEGPAIKATPTPVNVKIPAPTIDPKPSKVKSIELRVRFISLFS